MQELNCTRGHLLELRRCGNLLLTNVTFRNSPFWTLHPWACAGVTVTHCGIHAPLGSPNTDGFDPDSCSDVVFAHNTVRSHTCVVALAANSVMVAQVSSGDDHVSIKVGQRSYSFALVPQIPTSHPSSLTPPCIEWNGSSRHPLQHGERAHRHRAQCI